MPAPALAALLLLTLSAPALQKAPRPESRREFGAFMLGQYARNVEAKLGKPARTGTDEGDGETLWHYDLAPNAKTVLTFSISKDETPLITLIEVTGAPIKGAPELHGVALGASKAEILQKLGPPDATAPIKGEPGESLDWEDRNYYVELDGNGRVSRLQIVDNRNGYPKPGDTKPDLVGFQKALAARDREAILDYLSADIDLYTKTDETVGFVGSPREDILNEESLIARYLYGGAGSIREFLTPELAGTPPEPDPEGEPGGDPQWATVFPEGSAVGGFLWVFEAGRWRIWEVNLDPDELRRVSAR